MAATTQLAVPARTSTPLALWHLASLDAPSVAALWTFFLARACGIRLPLATPAAMFLAVWVLYAADRLLDARILDRQPWPRIASDLEARHYFHRAHRPAFLAAIASACLALAALLPRLDQAARRIFFIEGALVIAWLLIVHVTRGARRLPKELIVGLFFAAATFTPTLARSPQLSAGLLPAAALFAAVCTLNCLFIHAWERERPTTSLPRGLCAAAAVLALACLALALLSPARPIPIACSLAATALLALDRNRRLLSRTHLRAAADLALLTPILLLPFLR